MSKIELICSELKIHRVAVFSDRAELKRKFAADLTPGLNEIQIKSVPLSYIQESLRVDGNGEAVISEFLVRDVAVLNEKKDSPKAAELRREWQTTATQLDYLKDKHGTLAKWSEGLDKVATSGFGVGKNGIDENSIKSIESFFEYYKNKSVGVKSLIRSAEEELKKAEEMEKKAKENLKRLDSGDKNILKQFVIFLKAKKATKTEVEVSYQVGQASWTPSYDLRLNLDQSSMKVVYYAKITQTSGEDWTEVPLTLTTARPFVQGKMPELGSLEVGFSRPPSPEPMYRFHKSLLKSTVQGEEEEGEVDGRTPKKRFRMSTAEIKEQTLSMEFMISRLATIPTGEKSYKATIGIVDLKPQLVFECIPKKSAAVFLTASAVNSSQLAFLEGEAFVYLNSSMISTIRLNSIQPGERFTCSLGIDSAIRVTYKPVEKVTGAPGFLAKTVTDVIDQVINVRNGRKNEILLVLKEQVPRSTDSTLKVRVLNPPAISPAMTKSHIAQGAIPQEGIKITKESILEWTVKLAGGQIADYQFKYAIDYPQDQKYYFNEK